LLIALGVAAGAAGAATTQTGLTPVADKPQAADFSLQRVTGESLRLSDLKGQVVLVNFWATWCPPCREEMPSIHRVWQQLHDEGFEVLAVNLGEEASAISDFAARLALDEAFPLLLDPDGEAMRALQVRGLPTTYLIDKQGRKAYVAIGPREFDSEHIIGLIRGLMAL
jgi:peroxiredoxin